MNVPLTWKEGQTLAKDIDNNGRKIANYIHQRSFSDRLYVRLTRRRFAPPVPHFLLIKVRAWAVYRGVRLSWPITD